MQQAVPAAAEVQVVGRLINVLGRAQVIVDPTERAFYSQDVYRAGALPAAVIRPASTEQLAEAMRVIADSGFDVIARGGGMSYTDGYLPRRERSIIVDMLQMNRIVTIDPSDGYVTVECGSTWKELHDSLAPRACARRIGDHCRDCARA